MGKKQPVIFAKNNDEPLYVRLEAVIDLLTAMIDGGVSYTLFKDKTIPYMTVTAAIAWCEKEGEHHDKERYQKMIKTLKLALEQERDETLDLVPD